MSQLLASTHATNALDGRDVSLADELRRIGTERACAAGDVISDGTAAQPVVWFVLSGECRVTIDAGRGKQLVLPVLTRGDVIGDEHVTPSAGASRPYRVVASAPTRLLGVPADQARALLGRRPDLAIALLEAAIVRERRIGELAASVAYWSVERRLATLLVQLDERHGHPTLDGHRVLGRAWSQEELGAMIGVSRKAVVCTLATFRERGIVRMRGRRLMLVDLAGLQDAAEAA